MYDKEKRVDLSNITVEELIDELKKLSKEASVSCCGSRRFYLHVIKDEETVCIDMEEKKQIIVETPLGSLVIYQSGDPEYPGVYIDLRREGCGLDAPLAMVEYTATEVDLETPSVITRTWDDVRQEGHQTRVVHSGIEEYFREER